MKSQYSMVFYPQSYSSLDMSQTMSSEEAGTLLDRLTEEGFLGESFSVFLNTEDEEKETGYLIGHDFLKLITFLGCSPSLSVTIPEKQSDWMHFCHIEIQQHQSPIYFKGLNQSKCSCPQCKVRITKSLPDMEQWQPDAMTVTCPKCHHKSLVEALNWRHSSGFGTFFIVVHSVYPSESVPTERLMSLLNQEPFSRWDFFYCE